MSKPQEKLPATQQGERGLPVKNETIDAVSNRIKVLQNSGELHFPPDYSPQNALKSAWLILQNVVDRNQKPALQVCTTASIYNALLDMVITGLNPAKAQGYFIVYGNQLVFQRSYFGTQALAKRVNSDIEDITAVVVYKGDEFEYRLSKGKRIVSRHIQKLENINSKNIVAAYCEVYNHEGEIIASDIMTMDEIKKAWAMSKIKPITEKGDIKKGSTHDEFTEEMCKRTIINRTCKPIINSSDDKHLKLAASRSEVVRTENAIEEEIEEHANQDFIDVDEVKETSGQEEPREEQAKEDTPDNEEGTSDNNGSGRVYVHCENPDAKSYFKKRIAIEVCENNCRFFPKCETAQDALKKAMPGTETGEGEDGQKKLGPDF